MKHVQRMLATSVALGLILALAGMASPVHAANAAAAPPRCSLQIILVLQPPVLQRPPATLVAQLARAAGVTLAFVRDAGTGSHVFRLGARGDAAACERGLARLRADPRVESADVDRRRQAAGS